MLPLGWHCPLTPRKGMPGNTGVPAPAHAGRALKASRHCRALYGFPRRNGPPAARIRLFHKPCPPPAPMKQGLGSLPAALRRSLSGKLLPRRNQYSAVSGLLTRTGQWIPHPEAQFLRPLSGQPPAEGAQAPGLPAAQGRKPRQSRHPRPGWSLLL